ncbi:MAG TPA: hypothetical protein VGA17_08185 [Nitrospiraceae bacterium]
MAHGHGENGRLTSVNALLCHGMAGCLPSALLLMLAGVLGGTSVLHADGMLKMAELLAHPDQYDKQTVSVVGEVTNLQVATARDGQNVYAFLLKSGGGTVKVIGLGRTAVRDGEQVVVEGTFNRMRQGGRTAVLNEIRAELVRPLVQLTPDLVG